MKRIGSVGLAMLACAVSSAASAGGPHVSLAGRPPTLSAGRPWYAPLVVRPSSFGGAVHIIAMGPGRIESRATGGHGRYRARLVFPAAGRWTLSARAGGSTSSLGAIVVEKPVPSALRLAWPTSVDLQADGSLLAVENGAGRVVRVQPASGRTTVVASGLAKPYAVAHAPDGTIYLANAGSLQRLEGGKAPVTVARASDDIGPVAVGATGTVFYATGTQLFELDGSSPRLVLSQLSAPHGLAPAGDGSLLVSDTNANRVLRVDPRTGTATTFIRVDGPRGIDVAADGTIYLVEGTKGVGRYSASGVRLGDVGPAFRDPYDVAVAPDGTVYVVDTAERGTIRRVAPDGSVSTVGHA